MYEYMAKPWEHGMASIFHDMIALNENNGSALISHCWEIETTFHINQCFEFSIGYHHF